MFGGQKVASEPGFSWAATGLRPTWHGLAHPSLSPEPPRLGFDSRAWCDALRTASYGGGPLDRQPLPGSLKPDPLHPDFLHL